MNIAYSPVDEDYFKAKVEDGHYAKYERLMAALEVGKQDIREGRTVPYAPELLQQIVRDARRHAVEGGAPDPAYLA